MQIIYDERESIVVFIYIYIYDTLLIYVIMIVI